MDTTVREASTVVTHVMTLAMIVLVALTLVVSFVVWRVWVEHRRYDEFLRVLKKQPTPDPVHAIDEIPGGHVHRAAQQRVHAERFHAARRGARFRSHRLRIVEN